MATSLTTVLQFVMTHTYTNALDLSTPADEFRLDLSDTLANGTGADQADQVWHDRRTLAATTENLDLAGSLTNAFGSTLTFALIKGLLVHNRQTTAGETLTIGGAASAAFLLFNDATDKYVLGPNGIFFVWKPCAAGRAVTTTSADILKMDAGTASVSYDIWIIGASA